ncbi:MAG: hypothetical protein FWF90_15680 [Promicromonosporaceae bacterium]|nr:hypothetical protein [Promicromonosporaceae bacterium]
MTRSDDWSGSKVAGARERWASRLPLVCYLCGRPVLPGTAWVVEHDPPRAWFRRQGMRVIPASSEVGVSHRTCSDSSGGRMVAAARASSSTTSSAPAWRGRHL